MNDGSAVVSVVLLGNKAGRRSFHAVGSKRQVNCMYKRRPDGSGRGRVATSPTRKNVLPRAPDSQGEKRRRCGVEWSEVEAECEEMRGGGDEGEGG